MAKNRSLKRAQRDAERRDAAWLQRKQAKITGARFLTLEEAKAMGYQDEGNPELKQ